MFKIGIKSESEFNEVMAISESMGYYRALDFKDIPNVKTLFLPSDSKHIQWSHRPTEEYKFQGKEVSILELKQIAAGHRIESSNSQAISKAEKQEKHIDSIKNYLAKQDFQDVKQCNLTGSHINESYKLNRLG